MGKNASACYLFLNKVHINWANLTVSVDGKMLRVNSETLTFSLNIIWGVGSQKQLIMELFLVMK